MEKFFYLLSMPERGLRALAAGLGGPLYELAGLLLPGWLRGTRLYQALAGRSLRIIVEGLGGVEGLFPPGEVDSRELAIRKGVGTGLEMVSLVTVGFSPLWVLAATADLTGGTSAYLDVLVAELKRKELLAENVEVATAQGLLRALEATSGAMAEAVDVPPLSVEHWRSIYRALRGNAANLPRGARLTALFQQLRQASRREGQSLWTVSSLLAASALRAGVQMGQTHVFDHYHAALEEIRHQGIRAFAARLTQPYGRVAAGHFDWQRQTGTERLLRRLLSRGDKGES